jgi:hypothetical protein
LGAERIKKLPLYLALKALVVFPVTIVIFADQERVERKLILTTLQD